jgi:predicted enzyme related to lactoylglutathione lyase
MPKMLNLNSIMIGTKQTRPMVAFYEKVLGKAPDMADSEHDFFGWQLGGTMLSIYQHSEMGGAAKDPGRVLINFETPEVQKEFDRLKDGGAVVVKEPYDMAGGWIATLADPDGNYFQLITPMPM